MSLRLEEAAKEASEKAALAAELKSRLEEVQVGTAVVLTAANHRCVCCVSHGTMVFAVLLVREELERSCRAFEKSASEYSAPLHTPLRRDPVLPRMSSRRLGVPVIRFQEMEMGLRWFVMGKSEKNDNRNVNV